MLNIICPAHYVMIIREGADWLIKKASWFYRDRNTPADPTQINYEAWFGISRVQIVIELFRINGGKPGYYLANLRDKKYYYCGQNWEDIRTTLLSLGIGQLDPLEK